VTFWLVALLGHVVLLMMEGKRRQGVEKRRRTRDEGAMSGPVGAELVKS
jgi:hypothetical protein